MSVKQNGLTKADPPCFSPLLVGGNANNGANDGPFYWNWNNTASNSNWNYGGRPPLLTLNLRSVSLCETRREPGMAEVILTPW